MLPGVTSKVSYFTLVAATNYGGAIEGNFKNRRGNAIPAWDLTEDADHGSIHAYYLHYAMDGQVPGTLGLAANDPDFFVTAALNGCSFSFAQNGPAAAALVAHHNSRQDGNNVNTILAQPAAPNAVFFHQSDYRKTRNGAVDTSYEGALVGRRDDGNIWRFYLQSKKGLTIPGRVSTVWRMKDVIQCNP